MAIINARLLFIVPLCFTSIAFADDFFTPPLQQIKCVRRIIFVEDAHNKQFILKYPRSPNHALNDALGAEVGTSIGVNINHVKIFPPYDPSLGSVDKFPHHIKTLHTLVPGNEVRKMNNAISFFSIRAGLTNRAKLESLMTHKDLYKIVALDIFLNNSDRHNGNLFYDEENDHFYAIDMDALFCKKRLLATKAGNFIQGLDKKRLSPKAKAALKNLHKILDDLITLYPPEKLCELKKRLAAQAHYAYTTLEQENFRKLIEYNFNEIKRLQRRLSRLLG